jgi:Rrf2 family protein
MRLTARSEYALLALIALARWGEERRMQGEVLSERTGVPPKFLQQILLSLRRAHYVQSAKGPSGGYRLAKDPADITIAEVVRLFDGPLAPTDSVSEYFYEPTPIEKEATLLKVFREVRDMVAAKLEGTTIADVM